MERLTLGIEHLMTGVTLTSDSPITFEYETPSMVQAVSATPIRADWRGITTYSSPGSDVMLEFSDTEVMWFAQDVAQAMRTVPPKYE